MLYCMYILKDKIERIRSTIKKIKDEETDLSIEKGKLNSIIYDMKLALNEFIYITKNNNTIYDDFNLTDCLKKINNIENGKDFKGILQQILSIFEDYDFQQESHSNNAYYHFFEKDIITHLINTINDRQRTFNIFENQCLNGDNLKEVKLGNKNAITYGLENINSCAENAKAFVDKIIKGNLKGSRISNEVFDFTICTAKCEISLENNLGFAGLFKPEKNLIHQMLRYTRDEGVFFIAIPYYRLYKDICNLLAKNLKDIRIIKGIKEDKNVGLVYIIGQKKTHKEIDKDTYNTIRKCYDYSKIKTLEEIDMPKYTLPGLNLEVDIFKGSILDAEELLSVLESSDCIDNFFEKQKVIKIHESTIEPLLPFNVGQIGLVLTSGCLDGIIEEGDGHSHLVKGRVAKKTEIDRKVLGDKVEEIETCSNKVEINVLLPNGDFKVFA